ncbi:MAG: hypothetical protein NWQ40_06045 [Schleiferiaceae bacterium]|nr:hypothetical protein [Schleiferiaceae bacterium]
MHPRQCLFFFALSLLGWNAVAQVAAPAALDRFASRALDSAWRPEVLGYIRNTEFFHPAEEGRTRFGALVGLRRGYELKNGRNAELGLMANQSFGAAPQMLPWVVLRAKGAGYQIQFGSIADRGHGLPRQLLNPDLRYAVPVVYGFSGTSEFTRFRVHYWAEWLTAIDYGSPFKERIHGGATAGWVGEHSRLEGVLQYHHVGGQIDSSPEADGNRLNYGLMGQASLGAVELRAAHLRYADPLQRFGPEAQGFGTSAEVSVTASPKLRIEASYWQAENFRAPLGQGIFQSRNPEDPSTWYREQPQLLGLGLAWEGLASLRIRAWYDVADRSVQPSVTWVRYVVLDPL